MCLRKLTYHVHVYMYIHMYTYIHTYIYVIHNIRHSHVIRTQSPEIVQTVLLAFIGGLISLTYNYP